MNGKKWWIEVVKVLCQSWCRSTEETPKDFR